MHRLRFLIASVGIGVLCSGCVMSGAAESRIRTTHNNNAVDRPSQSTFGWHNMWWAIDGDVLSIKGSSHNAREHQTYYVGFMNADGGRRQQRTYYYQEHHLLLQVQDAEDIPSEGAACDAIIDLILEWKSRKHTHPLDLNSISFYDEQKKSRSAHPEDLRRYRGRVKVYIDYEAEELSKNGRRYTPERWRISLFDSEIARVGHPDETISVNGTLTVRHSDKTGLQRIDSDIEDSLNRLSIADVK